MPDRIVSLNEESLRADLGELVRRTVEDTLNGLLESESESTPVPLTHRVPFRHDVRNGERRQGWDDCRRSTQRSSSSRRCGCTASAGGTYAEIARELGYDAGSISDWMRRADAAGADPSANPFQVAEEIRRLKRENERLKKACEMLLKASAFFASRQL